MKKNVVLLLAACTEGEEATKLIDVWAQLQQPKRRRNTKKSEEDEKKFEFSYKNYLETSFFRPRASELTEKTV